MEEEEKWDKERKPEAPQARQWTRLWLTLAKLPLPHDGLQSYKGRAYKVIEAWPLVSKGTQANRYPIFDRATS